MKRFHHLSLSLAMRSKIHRGWEMLRGVLLGTILFGVTWAQSPETEPIEFDTETNPVASGGAWITSDSETISFAPPPQYSDPETTPVAAAPAPTQNAATLVQTPAPVQIGPRDASLRKPEIWPATAQPTEIVAGNSADEITPEIRALAAALQYDTLQLFNFVYNNIEFELYYGSKKGAHVTLLERAGNDVDQCALLVALLRASGKKAGYEKFLWGLHPDGPSQASPNAFTLDELWGFSSSGATQPAGNIPPEWNWSDNDKTKYWLARSIALSRGFPVSKLFNQGSAGPGRLYLDMTTVKMPDDAGRRLVPWVKKMRRTEPVLNSASIGFDRDDFLAESGGQGDGRSIRSINKGAIHDSLKSVTTATSALVRESGNDASIVEFLGKRTVVPRGDAALPSTIFEARGGVAWGVEPKVPYFEAISQNAADRESYFLKIKVGTTSEKVIPLAQVAGRRLAIRNGEATVSGQRHRAVFFYLDDTQIHRVVRSNWSPYSVKLTVVGAGSGIGDLDGSYSWSQVYDDSSQYVYVFPTGWSVGDRSVNVRLQKYEKMLSDARIAHPLAFDSTGALDYSKITNSLTRWSLIAEALYIRGLNYLRRTHQSQMVFDALLGQTSHDFYTFGALKQTGSVTMDWGLSYGIDRSSNYFFQLAGSSMSKWLVRSVLEHAEFDFTNGQADQAFSTIQVLALAANSGDTNRDEVFWADNTTWASTSNSVKSRLKGYTSTSELNAIGAKLAANDSNFFILPENRSYTIGGLSGYGYIGSERLAGDVLTTMGIQAGTAGSISFGGIAVEPGEVAPVNPTSDTSAEGQETTPPGISPGTNGSPESGTPGERRQDPVDFATGSLWLDHEDLSLGSSGVRGLSFARSYRSNRTNTTGDLGHGWTHNHRYKLSIRTSPNSALGSTTPAAAATMAATCIMLTSIISNTPTLEELAKAAVLTKVAFDELINNAVVIEMGTDTLEFIRQADGSYIPPAGSTFTLTRENNIYKLKQRHGDTYRFDVDQEGRLLDITDPFDKARTYEYISGRLHIVKDAYDRTLTFGYTPGADTIATIDDSTGRQIRFFYLNGDLHEVYDPENKKTTYTYQDHLLTLVTDPKGRVTVDTAYDANKIVQRQLNKGDPTRRYDYVIAGTRSAERDPAGGVSVTYFDAYGRPAKRINQSGEISLYSYDGQNHLTGFTSPRGEVTTYTYDADHNLLTSIDSLGLKTTNIYDSFLRLKSVTVSDTDANSPNRVTNYIYAPGDTTNRPERVTTADNRVTRFLYYTSGPAVGQLWKSIEVTPAPVGELTTEYIYDERGMPKETIFPDNTKIGYTYDVRGDLKEVMDQRLVRSTTSYNLRRQPRYVTIAVGTDEEAKTEFIYDDAGDLEEKVDATARRTRYTTDASGKVKTETVAYATPLAATTIFDYNTRDLLEKVTDATSRFTFYDYDPAGRRKLEKDPLNNETVTTYDANGRLQSRATPLENTWQYERDAHGFETIQRDPQVKDIIRTPNGYGELWKLKNRRAKTWTHLYDKMGRLTDLQSPLNKNRSYTYTDRGLLTTATEPSNETTTYTYYKVPRIKSQTDALGVIDFHYDDAGNMKTVTEGTAVISREFDYHGRVSAYVNAESRRVGYKYDKAGRLQRLTYPGATFWVDYDYDAAGRLRTVTDSQGRVTLYGYDAAGRLELVRRPNWTERVQRYDAAGRLDFIHETDANRTRLLWRKFTYDADSRIRNLLALPTPAAFTEAAPATTVYDDDNRLQTWGSITTVLDADGNMTFGPAPDGTATTTAIYEYDARNRLKTAGDLTYTYDAENNRTAVTKAAGTVNERITRYDFDPVAGGLPRVVVRRDPQLGETYYVYGLGLCYEVTPSNGAVPASVRYYHGDHLGNTLALTDAAGTLTDTMGYTPYGKPAGRTGTTPTPFLYGGLLGVQTDANGLVYMRARYYNVKIMRFLNADPIGFAGGMNWYAYANGNPMSFADPSGFCGEATNNASGAAGAQDVRPTLTPSQANEIWRSKVGGVVKVDVKDTGIIPLIGWFKGTGDANAETVPAGNNWRTYGNVNVVLGTNGLVTVQSELYDFDQKETNGSFFIWARNVETRIGEWWAGDGAPFTIEFVGTLTPLNIDLLQNNKPNSP